MIQIRQLEKIYRSRLGGGCKALSNISLDFPDKGMVFILGRSGSGKSTLLNLLGGLDKATSGEIIYKGQSIKKFKDRDYDSYRNNVGFVFQDFNLLDNMTVRENLALALELKSGNVNDEEIIRALEVADIAELINRYPNELSGGQKQRAALARAIVKDPDIILADEPTGNLDTENGKIILDKLKELSINKLVIIVSHDREFADIYGDRVIELEDGAVVSDTDEGFISQEELYYSEPLKSSLKLKYCLKIIKSNLLFKPLRLLIPIILTAITLALLSVSQAMSSFNVNEAHARNLINDYDYMSLAYLDDEVDFDKDYLDFYYHSNPGSNLSANFLDNFEERYPEIDYDKLLCMKSKYYSVYHDNIFGFELMSDAEPLQENSFYITDVYAYRLINERYFIEGNKSYCIYNDDEYIKINSNTEMTALICRDIYESRSIAGEITYRYVCRISGILVTGDIEEFKEYNEIRPADREYNLINNKIEYKLPLYYSLYISEDYSIVHSNTPDIIYPDHNMDIHFNSSIYNTSSDWAVFEFEDTESPQFYIISTDGVYQNEYLDFIEESESYQSYHVMEDFVINQEEIVLTVGLYNQLFDDNYNWVMGNLSPFSEPEQPVIPQHLGEKVSFTIYDDNGDVKASIMDYTLIGVVIPDDIPFDVDYDTVVKADKIIGVMMNSIDKEECFGDYPYYVRYIIFSVPEDKQELIEMMEYYENWNIYPMSPIAEALYRFTLRSEINVTLIVLFSYLFIIFTVILLSNYIGTNIKKKISEIGILRSQGASKWDILKIFLLENLIIVLLIIVLGSLVTLIALGAINKNMEQYILQGIEAYSLNGLSYFYMLVFPIIIVLIAAASPLLSITRLKPIDAIKSVT